MGRRSFGTVVREAFFYRTAKLIEIRNAKLGLLHHGIQLLILAYVVGWVIVYNQGYQTESKMVPSFFTKTKGVASFQSGNSSSVQVMDAMDVVLPPLEQDAVFVGMRFALTKGQKRGICPGNFNSSGSDSELCSAGCQPNRYTRNGIMTGKCDELSGFCLIKAWCPLEPPDDELDFTDLIGVRNFTIFLRANVQFPTFGITIDNVGKSEPQIYRPEANSSVNNRASIWALRDILALAGASSVNRTGAVIVGVFEYSCDFNQGLECLPKVSFRRVDDPESNSSGFNYRGTVYSDSGAVRDLYKWFGVRLVLIATGYGKKFTSIVPAVQAFGAGVALIAVATLVCDFLVEYILPHRKRYTKNKVKGIDDPSSDDDAAQQDEGVDRPLVRKDSEDQIA